MAGKHRPILPPRLLRFSSPLKPDPGIFWYYPHIREDYAQEMGLYGNIIVVPSDPTYWSPVNRELARTLDRASTGVRAHLDGLAPGCMAGSRAAATNAA